MTTTNLPSVLRVAALVLIGAGGLLILTNPGCANAVACAGDCNEGGQGGQGGHGGQGGQGGCGVYDEFECDCYDNPECYGDPGPTCYDCACASDSPCLAVCDAAGDADSFCTDGETQSAACAACVEENCGWSSLDECLEW